VSLLSLWFRALAPYLCAALLALLAVQTVRIEGFKIWPFSVTGLKAELADVKAELKRVSDAKNVQKRETKERIKVVERVIRDADGRARTVEQAPPAPECRTKPEILQADL
jgi:hypothetical protein